MFLALYSITDKQKYIFVSPKLQENIGASVLIDSVFRIILPDCITDFSTKGRYKSFDFLNNDEDIFDNNGMIKEGFDLGLLLFGGGNALLYFKNKDIYYDFNKLFSKRVFEESGGGINLVFTILEYEKDKSYQTNYNNLVKKLSSVKKESTPTFPLLGVGITQFSDRDGLPVVKRNDRELSFLANKKVKKYNDDNFISKYFGEAIHDTIFKDNEGIKEFDNLLVDNDNRLGIVHIDGNNMGKQIKEILSKVDSTTLKEPISVLKDLSIKIDNTYKQIFLEMADEVTENKEIRPIVLAGDDVTYAISGKVAIYSAKRFLEILSSKPPIEIRLNNGSKKVYFELSACAGVAIVNKHYPFYRAYMIAEELCESAKKRAKNDMYKINGKVGNWIDFQLLITSYIKDLHGIREEYYRVLHHDGIRLYLKPYCIDKVQDNKIPSFSKFEELYEKFEKWPRSRAKELRNVFIDNVSSYMLLRDQLKTRGYDLRKMSGYDSEYVEVEGVKCTPFFDPLELMGYYLKTTNNKKKNGGKSEN